MNDKLEAWVMIAALLGATGVGLAGCSDDGDDGGGYAGAGGSAGSGGNAGSGGGAGNDAGSGATLKRASRSSTIAISDDDALVAMVNPEAGTLSVFKTEDDSKLSSVPTGAEPSSVVMHPDGKTAFVANRADATVVKVSGVDTATPKVGAPLEVGSEPTGLALSPSGKRLFVAEWAEGRISVVDTVTMSVEQTIDGPKNPYALTVTNDLDQDDSDELLIVPEFYGEPSGVEGSNESRQGRVRVYTLSDLVASDPIVLAPIDSGFAPADGAPTAMTSPNQLGAVVVQGDRIYLPSIAVSPAPPVKSNSNVHPVVFVGDLATRSEARDAVGSANLARVVKDAAGDDPVLFLADLVDMAFIGDSNIAYVLSRGAEVVQRVVYDEAKGLQVGSQFNLQIDIKDAPPGSTQGCKSPTGIVTSHDAPRAYVNCWLSHSLGVVDLSTQSLSAVVESAPGPSGVAAEQVARGKHFFFTGRGRWSDNAWSSCASCHPGGLSDNVTWVFAAGPRQSTSLDGSFSHGAGPQKQRIFNWTGIFDELHDFERNTRGVQGGLGAITVSASGKCGTPGEEQADPVALPGNLAQPIEELQNRPENCTKAWDDVDAYIRQIRPPRGRRGLDPAAVARGAELFGVPSAGANNGGCVMCHGGAGFTVSRRFFQPTSATNTALLSQSFTPPAAWPKSWSFHDTQIAVQPAAADGAAQGPAQVACVLRNVGTFGAPGDSAATDALEVRPDGQRAQGAGGFNVPSLYGLSVGAPYLHHGGAATLEDLFDDPKWQAHLTAGNPVFLTTGEVEQSKQDLIAFLLSIDAQTPEQAIPAGQDGCPTSFP